MPMADLREMVGALGFGEVATYVQSGNVVFTGTGSPQAVARDIESRITTDFGLSVPVEVRSKPQLRRTVDNNPYAELEVDPKTIHTTFLSGAPDRKKVGALEELAGSFGSDQFTVVGTDVFLHCPGGYGETKLNNTFLERRLGVTATTRNWRTVLTLAEMAGL